MFLNSARVNVPPPGNDPILGYAPGSPERAAIKAELARMGAAGPIEIPMVIGGERVKTGKIGEVRCPHDHARVLATYHEGGAAEVERAADAAKVAWHDWSRMPWEARAAVFLRAAELLAGKHRQLINASTMLGQSKTIHQAEIDAACELVDFWRWNVHFAAHLYAEQPASAPGMWNALELRPLEGFVLAISPFNFTAIGGNLVGAPALMGNTVVWKPAPTALLSNWYILRILEEAGLPPGVVNLVSGPGPVIGEAALKRHDLAGVHFTGSTAVFQSMWKQVGERISQYRTYPRLVGETGGKDFIIAHPSADADAVITAIVRGGFEYQGQKCSAASRVYVPQSMWTRIESKLIDQISSLKMGDVADFTNFMGAVIDGKSFAKLEGAIQAAKQGPKTKVIAGGECDKSVGWFVRPTLVRTEDPRHTMMGTEYFGPLVTLFEYPDQDFDAILKVCDETSPYALTGAILSTDRAAINRAHDVLRHAAGNFYVNDKPTGAVVGQQPFGGARASGTNDKAGSMLNLLRWVSARTIKETFSPPTHFSYPFLKEP